MMIELRLFRNSRHGYDDPETVLRRWLPCNDGTKKDQVTFNVGLIQSF